MRHLRPASWLLAHLGAAALVAAVVAAAPPAAAPDPTADPVLASWKGGELRARDWLAAYAVKTTPEQRALATPNGRVQLLHELERYALLTQEAQRRGYDKHVVVQDSARKAAIDALLTTTLAVAPEAISDADVAARYEVERERYRRPLVRRASLIVVADEAAAKTLLRELHGATREQFGKVARLRSLDQESRRQSGELGWFSREGRGLEGSPKPMPTELVAAVYALPRVGALSPRPLRLAQGYGLVLLTGEQPGLEMPFAEVAAVLREQLAEQRSAQRVEELVAQLRASVKIELHPELLAPIVLDTTKGLDIPQGFPPYPSDPREGVRMVKPDKY